MILKTVGFFVAFHKQSLPNGFICSIHMVCSKPAL